MIIMLGIGSALAFADDTGKNPGYLSTPYSNSDATTVVRTAYGNCVHNGYYQSVYGKEHCGDSAANQQQVTRKVTYSESGTSLFQFNSTQLSSAGKSALRQLMQRSATEHTKIEQIVIHGYTDTIGNDGYNLVLSQMRANTVRDFLLSQGVESDTITAVGLGEENATASAACLKKYSSIDLTEINQATYGYATATPKQLAQINSTLAKFGQRYPQLVKCVAADRRVEITLLETKAVSGH
jgi:OOP family OmpA-OmpF porin